MERNELLSQNAREFKNHLERLGENVDAKEGFFGPASITWRLSRELVLLLFGMRALLLQIAHPKVAQAVADHSRYREDPLGRGIRTFTTVYTIIFSNRNDAINAALKLYTVHERVYGYVKDPLPPDIDAEYSANDPDLLFWVAATLIDTTIFAYEQCIEKLTDIEKEQYYQEAKIYGRLFAIPEQKFPMTWRDFEAWMEQTLKSDIITVTPTAIEIFHGLLYGTIFTRLLSPINYIIAAMTLPAGLIKPFGLKQNVWIRIGYKSIMAVTKLLNHLIPQRYRAAPMIRRHEKQLHHHF